MLGAAAGFVLGLRVRLSILTFLALLLMGLVTFGLPVSAFQRGHWLAFSCAMGSMALLIAGLVAIPGAALLRKPFPAGRMALLVRLAAVMFLLGAVLLEQRMLADPEGILVLVLFMTPLYLLARLLDAEAKMTPMQCHEAGKIPPEGGTPERIL